MINTEIGSVFLLIRY